MDNLSNGGTAELWKNSTPEDAQYLENLSVGFNIKNSVIAITSDAKESDGKSLFEWNSNINTGVIEEITRKDNKERIVEKEVNPDTLILPDDFFKVETP